VVVRVMRGDYKVDDRMGIVRDEHDIERCA
jgi:hypothetical protein